jgi:hypothetical protein
MAQNTKSAAKEILEAPTPQDIRRDGPKGGWNSTKPATTR